MTPLSWQRQTTQQHPVLTRNEDSFEIQLRAQECCSSFGNLNSSVNGLKDDQWLQGREIPNPPIYPKANILVPSDTKDYKGYVKSLRRQYMSLVSLIDKLGGLASSTRHHRVLILMLAVRFL